MFNHTPELDFAQRQIVAKYTVEIPFAFAEIVPGYLFIWSGIPGMGSSLYRTGAQDQPFGCVTEGLIKVLVQHVLEGWRSSTRWATVAALRRESELRTSTTSVSPTPSV